jgi:prepilin peptidase CpaA
MGGALSAFEMVGAGVALLASALSAWTDLRTGRIPNLLTIGALTLGLATRAAWQGTAGLLAAAVGALVAGLVPLLLFRARSMGGGDVKLLAALGALLGARLGLEVELTAFSIGAIQGVALWLGRGELSRGLCRVLRLLVHPFGAARGAESGKVAFSATEIRFAPAIFCAVAVVVGRAVAW